MHDAARQYVADQVAIRGPWRRVCEFGGRNINGTIRDLFTCDRYVAVDIVEGPGVDVVADLAEWRPRNRFDAVVCCEVFEHTPRWPEIIATAAHVLVRKGVFIVTAAGSGRVPHSALDGAQVRPGEWYGNVDPEDLLEALGAAGFCDVRVDVLGADVRAVATKGAGK